MPVIEGANRVGSATATYSFAVNGGAISTITLNAAVPAGAVVYNGWVEVLTPPTGASATIAVNLESAGDIVVAAAVSGAPWSTTGRKAIIPLSGATSVKTTVGRSIAITIAAGAVTAGVFNVVLLYK